MDTYSFKSEPGLGEICVVYPITGRSVGIKVADEA